MRILLPEHIASQGIAHSSLGGKALNLHKMQQQGFPVPGFVVLPAETIDALLQPVKKTMESICAKLAGASDTELRTQADALRKLLTGITIPGNELAALHELCTNRFGENYRVAVRSSAIAEDGSNASFAGQHDTLLFIGQHDMHTAIVRVLASGWSLPALKYRLIHNIPLNDIRFAIVIQQMVDAAISGIGFSMNLKGNLADMVLVAGYGLGEGVVSDQVETDTYTVSRTQRTIEEETAVKQNALVFSPEMGIVIEPVTGEKQQQPVLTHEQVFEVCDFMARAEKALHAPADIEFSFDKNGKLFLLQMRPVTTLHRDRLKIADNTNIVESYPGITLPLTYSFVLQAYANVFRGSSDAFMISAETIKKYEAVFDNLLIHVYGRIYYRLDNWYRMLALVHNSRKSMEAWENAVGLTASESDKVNFSFRGKMRTIVASLKLISNYKRGNRQFFAQFKTHYAQLRDYAAHRNNAAALWTHYEKSTALLFHPWHLTIVNDFLAFKAFGWLQGLLRRYKIGAGEELANDLLCGIGGVESEEAILHVLELKEEVNTTPVLKTLFEKPVDEIVNELRGDQHKLFAAKVNAYLEKFGDRTLAELKLETRSLRRHPEIFIGMLRNQLRSETTAAEFRSKQQSIRTRAESQVNAALRWYNPRRFVFMRVLKLARYGLQNRENMRFCRTRAYSAVKDIFLEVGRMMRERQLIETDDDVFYLTTNDLRDFCSGKNTTDRRAEIAALKTAYKNYAAISLPDRIIFMDDDLPVFDKQAKQGKQEGNTFRGIAVSKGVIESEAVVITEPELDTDVRGKILVSRMTDPGWIFLMAQAAGLVSEKGSLLSHTAIVGRELGIPVVVGVPGATTIFKTGDQLRLNGNAGTVELLITTTS